MATEPKKLNPNLTKKQQEILFNKGTEAPFSGEYLKHKDNGMYTCANCGATLFSSDAKYESNIPGLAGWPSFYDVAKSGAVELNKDNSYGMERIEATCTNCGAHLGHLFDDETSPNGKHFCINSACLAFLPKDVKTKE